MIKVEICVESVESATTAQQAGAYRVELCGNLAQGGTTPSYGQIIETRRRLDIKLYVIIRPRGGDFLYTDTEYEVMRQDVEFCGKAGCDGVVMGMLRADGSVDMQKCGELVGLAQSYGMGVTFHRAFDAVVDRRRSLEDIIELGCERILTSGGAATADEGIAEIRSLIELAAGRIIIMPGCGVTPENIERIITQTGCREIHGTFRSRGDSATTAENTDSNDYGLWQTDITNVRAAVRIAGKL